MSRGGRSRLTFTIDNTANGTAASTLDFTDMLPVGIEIASPANVFNDCEMAPVAGTVSAVPGSSVVSYSYSGSGSFPGVAAGASCAVSVDVVGTGGGLLANTSSDLIATIGIATVSSGKASAVLEVTVGTISLQKSFTDDPVPPGGAVNLEFVIENFSRDQSASGITFTDDLDAALSGLVATGLPLSNPCGAGSQLAGTGVLTLTGASLGPGGSCTFGVALEVPAAPAGAYLNTTSAISADLGGAPFEGDPASESLFVTTAPLLSKEFIDDPAGAGGTVTLRFTITNSSLESLSDIAFTDDLTTAIPVPGLAANSLVMADGNADPLVDVCGPGSELTLFDPPDIPTPPDHHSRRPISTDFYRRESCTLRLPGRQLYFRRGPRRWSRRPRRNPHQHHQLGDGHRSGCRRDVTGGSDDLFISGLTFSKSFTDDPVIPGGTVTLEFTLANSSGDRDASAISFTDSLAGVLGGLTATGLPMVDVCGTGSQLSGTTNLSFTGGNLNAGTSCTFSVTLQVPAMAASGTYGNTTSSLTATIDGANLNLPPATDQLIVSGDVLLLTKTFTDDPVAPGGTVTLEFTLANTDASNPVTGITFTDDLDAALAGLTAIGLPQSNVCGASSQMSGTSLLTLTGGSLGPGTSCTFSATLQVPALIPSGTTAVNTTSAVTGMAGGLPVGGDPAIDDLRINFLSFSKSFESTAEAGGTVRLTFHIQNLNTTAAVSALSFLDNLSTVLSGLAATGLPANNICGAGSVISGTSILTLSGGNLPPGGSCTFSVDLAVPAGAPLAGDFLNTTSELFVSGLPSADPASDTVQVRTSITNSATATASGAAPAMGQTTNTVQP